MGILNSAKDLFFIAKDKIQNGIIKIKTALAKFFEKALNLMKITIDKLAKRVRGVIVGAAHFYRRIGDKFQEGTKNYSLDTELGEWYETTVVKNVDLQDIPPQYRTMEEEFEIDDTRELNEALAY